jgi:hypothetical protein
MLKLIILQFLKLIVNRQPQRLSAARPGLSPLQLRRPFSMNSERERIMAAPSAANSADDDPSTSQSRRSLPGCRPTEHLRSAFRRREKYGAQQQ